ncbi:MAG: hypothetical protein ABUL62_05995 [Myxococcales bacterium]|jgi:hypothetical protein
MFGSLIAVVRIALDDVRPGVRRKGLRELDRGLEATTGIFGEGAPSDVDEI